jgi:hypothetical protein
MKKLSFLIIPILIIVFNANAQTQKGDQNLGLGFNFSTGSGNYNYVLPIEFGTITSTYFSASPAYSYFIANNVDLGASLGFGTGTERTYQPSNSSIPSKQVTNDYTTTLYLRKYFLFNNKIGIRTGPYFLYQYFNSNVVNNPGDPTQNFSNSGKNLQVGINADFVYYPSKRIGLAVNLGGLYYTNQKSYSTSQNSTNSTVDFQFLNTNLSLSAFYVIGH